MTHLELPSYLTQSDEVRDRFDRLKQRPVILEVKNLQKEFESTQGNVTALNDINFKSGICAFPFSNKNTCKEVIFEEAGGNNY